MDSPTLAPPAPTDLPTNGAAPSPPARRGLKRSTRVALIVIAIVALLAGIGALVLALGRRSRAGGGV